MRVSVRKTDAGYRPDAIFYKVFLNGEELRDCVTADEERGEAWVLIFQGNEVSEKCLCGSVRLERINS